MSTGKRWISVCVDTFEHNVFLNEPFTQREAWLWLIANAAWKDHRVRMGNSMVEIKRGQVIVGLEHLSKKWGWGVKKVRLFLDFLVSECMIEKGKSRGRFANVATICNYDKYQAAQDQQGQVEGQVQDRLRAGSGQHSTKDTNTQIKNTDHPLHQQPFFKDPYERVKLDEIGKPMLLNGLHAEWLSKFDNDEQALELALTRAAPYIQPNSRKPLEAQVAAQLATQLSWRRDADRRYNGRVKSSEEDDKKRKINLALIRR